MPPPVVKQRADAARNRAKILATAEEIFARDGLAASVDDIANKAKVGVGTLYRHFPTKEALIAAIVISRIARVAERAEALSDAPDPGAALFGLIEQMVAEGVQKRDFVEALGAHVVFEGSAAEAVRTRFRRALAKLLARAQAAGTVRGDVTAPDISALVRGVFAGAGDDARARARHLGILLDGLRFK